MSAEATILDDALGALIKAGGSRASRGPKRGPLTDALLAGKVVHFPDERNHFNATHLRRSHSVVLHTSLDDEGGRYWWVDPIDLSSI